MATAQDAVMDILLAAVRMDAALSLEPILELIAALARDLHADFLPYLPRVTAALSDLVDSGEHQHMHTSYIGPVSQKEGCLLRLAADVCPGLPSDRAFCDRCSAAHGIPATE
jgi:hypothetical protein